MVFEKRPPFGAGFEIEPNPATNPADQQRKKETLTPPGAEEVQKHGGGGEPSRTRVK